MSSQLSKTLFSAIPCRGEIINSRIVLAPINTGFSSSGLPTYRLLRFHRERSGKAVGLNIVGNVAIHPEGVSNRQNILLSEPSHIKRLAVIERAISRGGSTSGIQLAYSLPNLAPTKKWKNESIKMEVERLQSLVRSLPAGKISLALDWFILSASLADATGFKTIQIHAAHGYLLSLLLCPQVNSRTDRYAAHEDWLVEFVSKLRATIKEKLLSFRINLTNGLVAFDEEVSFSQALTHRLVKSGVDLIDFSAGIYTLDRNLIYPKRNPEKDIIYEAAVQIALSTSAIISVGADPVKLLATEASIPANLIISVGRPFIADHDYAVKIQNGHFQLINNCIRKGHCHYFSRGQTSLSCGVNPHI